MKTQTRPTEATREFREPAKEGPGSVAREMLAKIAARSPEAARKLAAAETARVRKADRESLGLSAKPYRQCLEEARRLGYLRCAFGPGNRLEMMWYEECESLRIPFIAFGPKARHFELSYGLPHDDVYELSDEALEAVGRKVAQARNPRATSSPVIWPNRGQVRGLLPDKVEALAFYLSEVLNDPKCLVNRETVIEREED